MATETFLRKNFRPDSLKWIRCMVEICKEYEQMGYRLSLRQVYYQLVAHHGLPNREQSYNNMGSLLTDARMAGLIDWDLIEDRNRETVENNHWGGPHQIVKACAEQFRIRLWDSQPFHVEVMVEKAALEGVLQPVCEQWDVPFTSNRGYSSASAMYENGGRLQKAMRAGKKVRILYFGDHDPSGIDMTRDAFERLGLFSGYLEYCPEEEERGVLVLGNAKSSEGVYVWDPEKESAYDEETGRQKWEPTDNIVGWFKPDMDDGQVFGTDGFQVIRMALNMDQVRQYNPPPNPAKMTDSRAEGYVKLHGRSSWELDALEPSVLAGLAESGIEEYLDIEKWEEANEKQKAHRARLEQVAEQLKKELDEAAKAEADAEEAEDEDIE